MSEHLFLRSKWRANCINGTSIQEVLASKVLSDLGNCKNEVQIGISLENQGLAPVFTFDCTCPVPSRHSTVGVLVKVLPVNRNFGGGSWQNVPGVFGQPTTDPPRRICRRAQTYRQAYITPPTRPSFHFFFFFSSCRQYFSKPPPKELPPIKQFREMAHIFLDDSKC